MVRGGGLVAVAVGVVAIVSGCSLPQSDACQAYVACQNAFDDTVDTADWEAGGRCWDLPDTARQCDARCRASLEALLATPDPPPVCLDAAGLANQNL